MGSRDLGATVWQFTYTHNPYNFNESMIIKTERSIKNTLPTGTLHMELQGQVSFMPYPVQEFHSSPTTTSKSQLTRLFIGQLPYHVTDMQLEWLCYTFGRGASVHYPERIVKKEKTNGSAAAPTTTKIPTGCVHVYVEPDQVEGLFNAMHKRVLVDDTGVWYAQTDEECKALDRYTQHLKVNKKLRFQNRPYDSIVVQYAMSTFVPPPPTYNMTVHPQEGTAASNHSTPPRSPQQNNRSSQLRGGKGSTSPPPPEYSVMNYAAVGAPLPLYPMQHEVMR